MLSTEWLSAFAPVGELTALNQWSALGAGVFFHKPPCLWLVTARHVVQKVGQQRLSVLVTRSIRGGVIVVEIGKILAENGVSLLQDENNDLAAAPMPVSSDFGIKAVTAENCVLASDLVPSMPCFTVGCPYGLQDVDPQSATPLVLDGVISGVNHAKRKVYTSAPTFPGNSGGPLIAVRSPFSPEGTMVAGRPTVLLAGIMLSTSLIQNPDPRSAVPSLHLGVAVASDAVLALLNSDDARAIASRLGVFGGSK